MGGLIKGDLTQPTPNLLDILSIMCFNNSDKTAIVIKLDSLKCSKVRPKQLIRFSGIKQKNYSPLKYIMGI